MTVAILRGDARQIPLPDGCVDLIVTSPPYFGLRSYTDACDQCAGAGRAHRPDSHGLKVCPNGCEATARKRCHYCGASMRWPKRPEVLVTNCEACHGTGRRHYDGQIGSEATPAEWLAALVACTREWVRVLKPEGSIFINLGDKYVADSREMARHKSLLGLPWRYALAATDQLGLILRRDIIWAKPNGLPESVTDRCRSSHEYVFHLVRSPRYYAAIDEIREPHQPQSLARTHRNRFAPDLSQNGVGSPNTLNPADACNPLGKLPGSVWTIPSQPLTVPPHLGIDHFAAFPVELPRRCVLGWSPPGVCVACGQGRRPVTRVEYVPQGDHNPAMGREKYGRMDQGSGDLHMGRFKPQEMPHGRANASATITGYACACPAPDAPTRPALVLDPFAGTGTTLLAAAAYGRNAIGIDRSADYCRLAKWRVHDPSERAKAMQVPKPPPIPDGMEALF